MKWFQYGDLRQTAYLRAVCSPRVQSCSPIRAGNGVNSVHREIRELRPAPSRTTDSALQILPTLLPHGVLSETQLQPMVAKSQSFRKLLEI